MRSRPLAHLPLSGLLLLVTSGLALADDAAVEALMKAAQQRIGHFSWTPAEFDANYERLDEGDFRRWLRGELPKLPADARLTCHEWIQAAAIEAKLIGRAEIAAEGTRAARAGVRARGIERPASDDEAMRAVERGFAVYQRQVLGSLGRERVRPLAHGEQLSRGAVVYLGPDHGHLALATGRADASGSPELLSLWGWPEPRRGRAGVRRTNLETLRSQMFLLQGAELPVEIRVATDVWTHPPYRRPARSKRAR